MNIVFTVLLFFTSLYFISSLQKIKISIQIFVRKFTNNFLDYKCNIKFDIYDVFE